MRADEKLTAFLEPEAAMCAAERPEDRGARDIKDGQLSADRVKVSSITSSDSFTLSSARLNKPPGLDIR